MKTLKCIAAVLTGIIVIVLVSTGTDYVLEKFGAFTPIDQGQMEPWMLALAFFYRTIYGVAGGYITAAMAPSLAMRHSIILGIIGTMASILGAIVGWNLSAHWYPIALVITALPSTWLGGKLKSK